MSGGSKITEVNGGSSNPNGFDVDDSGKIVSVGENVVLWVSADDIGKYVSEDIPKENIHIYTQGNVQGTEGKSDVFVLHEGSTYTQGDNTQHAMNAVNGNREPSSSDAHDYIFVAGSSSSSASAGSANVNNSINYFESINVTIGGKTYQGNNRLTDVISGNGEEKLDPGHSDTKTSWQYELNIDADLNGGAEGDHIKSITLNGLPVGSVVSYTDADGHTVSIEVKDTNGITIDVGDNANLDMNLTVTSPTEITGDHPLNVDVTVDVGNEEYPSGPIVDDDTTHRIPIVGGEETHSDDTVHTLDAADDVSHSSAEHTDTANSADQTEETSSTDHAEDSSSTDQTDGSTSDSNTTDADGADQTGDHTSETDAPDQSGDADSTDQTDQTEDTGSTDLTDDDASADDSTANLLVDDDHLDLSGVDSDNSQLSTAEESPESSLNLLLDDIDTQLAEADSTQSTEPQADTSAAAVTSESDQESTLDLSDIIHDDDSKDLSSLIQVADTGEHAETAGEVQDVPAESGGDQGGDAWTAPNAAELDHLIAQPDTDS